MRAAKIFNKLTNLQNEKDNKNDPDGALKAILSEIDSPEVYKKVEYMLQNNTEYKSSYMYSPLEYFIQRNVSGSSIQNNSSPELEAIMQRYIEHGIIQGDDAIKTQARLASRLIFDGCDGFGTHEDVVDKGVNMIKSPIETNNPEENTQNALKVLQEVDNIVQQHKTFYGLGNKFETLEEYLKDDLNKGELNYADMIMKLNGLRETKFQMPTINNLDAKYSSNPTNATKLSVIKDMARNLQLAIKDLHDTGIENGGIFADMADSISGLWNFEGTVSMGYDEQGTPIHIKGNEHGNKSNLVKKDIIAYYNNIITLVNALEEGNFDEKYKEIFGVEYNEDNIKNYNNAFEQNEAVIKGQGALQNLQEQIISMEKLNDEEFNIHVCSMFNIDNAKQIEIKQKALEQGISERDIYGMILEKAYSDAEEGFKNLLNGKTPEDFEKALKNTRVKAFGKGNPNSDIVKRVEDYNISQIEGAANCQTASEALLMATVMIASGGGGAVMYGAVTGGSHFTLEMLNKASSYEGNTWEHTKIATWESLVDGVLSACSDGLLKPLLDKRLGKIVENVIGKKSSEHLEAFLKGAYKYGVTALRNYFVEDTKALLKTGELNDDKAEIKTAFATGVKAMVKGKSVASKYLLDKAVKKGGTGTSYNTFCKEFQIDDFRRLCEEDSEIKKLMEMSDPESFNQLVYETFNMLSSISINGQIPQNVQQVLEYDEIYSQLLKDE